MWGGFIVGTRGREPDARCEDQTGGNREAIDPSHVRHPFITQEDLAEGRTWQMAKCSSPQMRKQSGERDKIATADAFVFTPQGLDCKAQGCAAQPCVGVAVLVVP